MSLVIEENILYIAILEDDADIAGIVKNWLSEAGHHCRVFNSGKKLTACVPTESFDFFVLDWNVNDMSGLEVAEKLREGNRANAPILFVTVRNAEADIVSALHAGADDFMVKPIRRGELVARINALLRRSAHKQPTHDEQSFPPYRVVPSSRQIFLDDSSIELTEKEFDLSYFLFKNAGKLLSRQNISESVWGRPASAMSRTIDTHVSRIRKKLSLEPRHGYRLVPIYNMGYRLEPMPKK